MDSMTAKFIDDVTIIVGFPKKNPPEGGDGWTEGVTFLRTPARTPERARPKASARQREESRNGERTHSFIALSILSQVDGHSGSALTSRSPTRKRSM